jgi:hypothetical protein
MYSAFICAHPRCPTDPDLVSDSGATSDRPFKPKISAKVLTLTTALDAKGTLDGAEIDELIVEAKARASQAADNLLKCCAKR